MPKNKWYPPRSKLRPLKRALLVSLSAASRGVCYLVFPSLAQKRKFTFVSLASLGNKNLLAVLFLLVFFLGVFFLVADADAAANTGLQYTLLEKIPGFNSEDGSNLKNYLEALYRFALITIVLSAVFMLSVGGFFYLTSAGNTSALSTAKSIIFDALIGLVIALVAYLILNVINPDLVDVSINGLSPVSVAPAPGAVPVTPPTAIPPGAPWPSDASERAAIKPITVNVANCTTKGQTGCTSLAGSAAIGALKALDTACGNCSIVVSGGTECWLHGGASGCTGGSHHNQGDYAIDIKHGAIDSYITRNGTKICEKNGRPLYKIGNAIYWDEDSAHWHANFNNSTCTNI